MYAHERSLVNEMSGRPFVLLGVNSDKEKETVKKAIEENNLNWRSWWDESTSGPIAKKFSPAGFPTLLLIDHTGVIRFNTNADGHGQVLRNPKNLDVAIEQFVSIAESDSTREFVDVTGKHKTVAKYLDFENGKVVLLKENDKEVKVPFKALSADDRKFVAKKRLVANGRGRFAGASEHFEFQNLFEFTDALGENSIKGTYIALENGKAVIWKEDGSEIAVSLKDLSKESREHVYGQVKKFKDE